MNQLPQATQLHIPESAFAPKVDGHALRKRLMAARRTPPEREETQDEITAPIARPVIQQPAWFKPGTRFNSHVIDWLAWKLAGERGLLHRRDQRTFETTVQCEAPMPESAERITAAARRSMLEICMEVLRDRPHITLDDLKGRSRTKPVVEARQLAMYRIYKERPDLSLPVMGRYFGRDHTTIVAAVFKLGAIYGNLERRGSKR